MKAVRLKTEYLKSPVGIDVQRPRIFWNCEGGKKQTAYRIVTEKWDSGKVDGDTMRAEYPLTLASRERVNYTVTLWDENGVEGEPSTDFFEFGLSREDWRAKWITGDYTVRPRTRYPVDCFKKE
ncbi:MAG: alfa-L-rhamnosidase, partial [Clostridia bacterium]|nr:alfa-L-rhamnosidase [Clostridia bacterium]